MSSPDSASNSNEVYFEHPKGSFPRLTSMNYPSWKNNMKRLLIAMCCWDLVTGDKIMPLLPTPPAEGAIVTAADATAYQTNLTVAMASRKEVKNRQNEAASAMYNACGIEARIYIDGVFDPVAVWDTLAKRFNTASTRQALLGEFMALRPTPGLPIGDYFSKLLEIRNHNLGTDEAISDTIFKYHVFTTLPDVFDLTVQIIRAEPDLSIEEVIDSLNRDEAYRLLRTPPNAATDAFYTYSGRRNRQENRRRTNRGGNWCTFCRRPTHNTEDCFSKPGSSKAHYGKRRYSDNDEEDNVQIKTEEPDSEGCWYCGTTGHRARYCPVKKAGSEARNRFQAFKKMRPSSG
jgi:hypothetical protein